MARTPFIGVLLLFLAALQIEPIGQARAQGTTGHDHLTEVACVDVPPGQGRPSWLLQRRHGYRTSFQSSIRLLAFAHVSRQEGCGGGQECEWNRRARRRASVALGIRRPKQCAARRRIHRRRRTSATSRSKELRSSSLLRCHATRRQFQSSYTPWSRRLVRDCGSAVLGDAGWRYQGCGQEKP